MEWQDIKISFHLCRDQMPEFCKYANCHNLASWTYQGYCNEEHRKRGPERELLMTIVHKVDGIGTIKEARQFLKEWTKERQEKKGS